MADLDVAPLADPDGFPSEEDLREMDPHSQAEFLKEWFLFNFEGPEQHTPRSEGDFVYVWGGPYDARDQLSDVFDTTVSEEALDLAVERVERIGFDWVPHDRRIVEVPEYPDDNASAITTPQSVSEWQAEVRTRLDDLEASLSEVREAGYGKIGHNAPPEAIEEEPLPSLDLDEIAKATDDGRAETETPKPKAGNVQSVLATFSSTVTKIVTWAAKKADIFADAAMKTGGAVAGPAALVWAINQLPGVYQTLLSKLQAAIASLEGLLHHINLPF